MKILHVTQESSSQSSTGELSSSQVELNQNSKPPSRQSSCLNLNSAKVHPELMPENQRAFTPVEIPNISNCVGLDCGDAGKAHRDSVHELAAARSEGSQREIPTYKIYAMSVRFASGLSLLLNTFDLAKAVSSLL